MHVVECLLRFCTLLPSRDSVYDCKRLEPSAVELRGTDAGLLSSQRPTLIVVETPTTFVPQCQHNYLALTQLLLGR